MLKGWLRFGKLIRHDIVTNIRFSNIRKCIILNIENSPCYSTANNSVQNEESAPQEPQTKVVRKERVSRAMRAYVERAQEHDAFMKQQILEYNIGKRHLANMMGEDPENFTQRDIDEAIAYLLPSGLYDVKARPLMRHPKEVFPQRKAAEFDESGRPFHYMFYTGKPNFFNLLHEIVSHIKDLNRHEDQMIQKHLTPDGNQALDLIGSEWLPKDHLEKMLVESIIDAEYNNFVNVMERLLNHPYSYRLKDFIIVYRKPLISQTRSYEIPKPEYDSDGRAFVTTKQCLRKDARAQVTVRSPGTGRITINGKGIDYFEGVQPREQLLFPLIFTNMVGTVDVEATVERGGFSGQAGAIRWGISTCLQSFVDQDMVERMRLAGLLQRDYRKRERKKPGQAKARKKFTWKKR